MREREKNTKTKPNELKFEMCYVFCLLEFSLEINEIYEIRINAESNCVYAFAK